MFNLISSNVKDLTKKKATTKEANSEDKLLQVLLKLFVKMFCSNSFGTGSQPKTGIKHSTKLCHTKNLSLTKML